MATKQTIKSEYPTESIDQEFEVKKEVEDPEIEERQGRKRGRPKTNTTATAAKKNQRKRKAKSPTPSASENDDMIEIEETKFVIDNEDELDDEQDEPQVKKTGRSKKNTTATVGKKNLRKRKAKSPTPVKSEDDVELIEDEIENPVDNGSEWEDYEPEVKKKGRSKKNTTTTVGKKNPRKRKAKSPILVESDDDMEFKEEEIDIPMDNGNELEDNEPQVKKRGRPKKTATATVTTKSKKKMKVTSPIPSAAEYEEPNEEEEVIISEDSGSEWEDDDMKGKKRGRPKRNTTATVTKKYMKQEATSTQSEPEYEEINEDEEEEISEDSESEWDDDDKKSRKRGQASKKKAGRKVATKNQRKRNKRPPTPITVHSEGEEPESEEIDTDNESDSEDDEPREPTVRKFENFDSIADSETLTKLMSNNDKDAVILMLAKRSTEQRQMIGRHLMMTYARNIMDELRGLLCVHFYDVIVGLMVPPIEYLSSELLNPVTSKVDTQALIDILCTHGGKKVKKLIFIHEIVHSKKFLDDLPSDIDKNFEKFISLIVTGDRKSSKKIKNTITNGISNSTEDEHKDTNGEKTNEDTNGEKTNEDTNGEKTNVDTNDKEKAPEEENSGETIKKIAVELFKAGEEENGINLDVFNRILAGESFSQLKLIIEEYKKIAGRTLEQAIKAEVRGPLYDAYMAVVDCAVYRPSYFAKQLNKVIDSHDASLQRIIINRSEIDLGDIKKEYEKIYGKTLVEDIKEKVVDENKKVLLALLGESDISDKPT